MPNANIEMGELKCYIHKDRTAVSKCDRCNKYTCLECQHEFDDTGFGDQSTNLIKICPFCYADEIDVDDDNKLFFGIIACFAFLIFIIIIVVVVASQGGIGGNLYPEPEYTGKGLAIFAVVFVILIISGVIIYFATQTKKEKVPNPQAVAIRAKAKKAMEESKSTISAEEKHTPLYCQFCGAPIEPDAKTCSYCGMNWIWKEH